MAQPKSTELYIIRDKEHVLVRRFKLALTGGPDAGSEFVSSTDRVVLGTHESADFVSTDRTMSRFHCEIVIGETGIQIRDLGSRNGTFLNGVQVEVAPLPANCTLTLGKTVLRFQVGDDNAPIAISAADRFGLLVGRSASMRAGFALLERAANSDATLLLYGETGTGKDLAAESVHLESKRKNGPFVVVECAAASANLIESDLFGHEKGAFTGADQARAGAFESAASGTLFLDEIGELPLDLQPKLLRVLESRQVQRVGSSQRIAVDVRVIAATHRNLRKEVNAQRFRSDLYYRLAVIEVTLPALRERIDDLPMLVAALLEDRGNSDAALVRQLFSDAALAALGEHSWPGNVRELKNHLEQSLALGEMNAPVPNEAERVTETDEPLRKARERWIGECERRYLKGLLQRHPNVTEAAKIAGVARVHLYRIMARYGLRSHR